jgi:hypothetical protein
MPGHDYDRMVLDLRTMTPKQRRQMLHDVIDNMHERDDADEIVKFLISQLNGDAEYVITSYAYPNNGMGERLRRNAYYGD